MAIPYAAIISANQARQQAIAEDKLRKIQEKQAFAKTLGGVLGSALAIVAPELIPALAPMSSSLGVAGMSGLGYAGGALATGGGMSPQEYMGIGGGLLTGALADRRTNLAQEELAGNEKIGMNKAFMSQGYMPTQLAPSEVGPRIGNDPSTSLPPGVVSYDPVFGDKKPMFYRKAAAGMSMDSLGSQLGQISSVASSSGFESDFTVKFGPNVTGRFKKPAGGVMGEGDTYSAADLRNALQKYSTGGDVKIGDRIVTAAEPSSYMEALYELYGTPPGLLSKLGGEYVSVPPQKRYMGWGGMESKPWVDNSGMGSVLSGPVNWFRDILSSDIPGHTLTPYQVRYGNSRPAPMPTPTSVPASDGWSIRRIQ